MSDVGARVADRVTSLVGSWQFIIIQSIILVAWIVMNCITWVAHWDPYPFILCNLALSFQAAFATPVILMSENRQAAKDRDTSERDLATDQKAERQIEMLLAHLDQQDHLMLDMLERIDALLEHRAVIEKKET